MRKFAIICFAIVVFGLLSGCETLDRWRDAIREKFSQTADNVNKKVEEVGGQIEKTRQGIEQKAADVQNAVKKVREAVDAVSKVTGTSPAAAGDASSNSTQNSAPAGPPSLNPAH